MYLVMSLGNVEKEIQCVLHWFTTWSHLQKQDFLKDLLDKLIPNYVDSLFDSMKSLGVSDKPPSIFQCQLKLFSQWFSNWTDAERKDFMIKIQCIDPGFVATFNEQATLLVQQGSYHTDKQLFWSNKGPSTQTSNSFGPTKVLAHKITFLLVQLGS
ncbi:unnamed protein product [Lymnaea stagnalis]|uniref:Uncharacterized protein n=1 Tax=Lymnaea stagnalis TaxID=6523 RepID=A0AAV2H9W6_LYMST